MPRPRTNDGVLDLFNKRESSATAAGEHAARITTAVNEMLETVTETQLGTDGEF